MSLTSVPGDLAALDAATRTFAARATSLDAAADRITRLSAPLADLRTASALRATELLAETGGGARAVGRLLTAVATVLTAFRTAVETLQAAASTAAEAYDDALRRQARWVLEEERLEAQLRWAAHPGAAGLGGIPPLEAAAFHQRLRTAQHERARAADDARLAAARHADVVAQHHDEAARTAAQIQALADTRAVRAWALEAGAGTVAQFQASRAAGVAVARQVRELAGMNPAAVRATKDAAAAMLAALRRGGDDPVFWTTLFGAVQVRELVVAADHAAPLTGDGAYRAGRSDDWGTILDALTIGSLAWAPSASPAERAAFGREVGGVVVEDGDAGSQVAQALLGQRAPAGADGGGAPRGDVASRGDETAFAQIAAGFLTRLDDARPALDEPYPVVGRGTPALAAAAAFADLARDPGIVFDYLAADDPHALDDRARRWLGKDIAWPDGGLAVATAFGAAVLTGTGSGKRPLEARSAQLVSVATDVLPGGLLGRRAPLPPAAERAVAAAYGPYLQTAGDLSARTDVAGVVRPALTAESTPVDGRPGTRPDAPLAFGLGAMPHVVQARLDPFLLREVVAGTSGTSAGAATWLALDEAYEDAVLATVLPPDGSAPASWTRIEDDADVAAAVRELHRDTGTVEGALQVRSVERAEVVEQGREAGVDLVMTVTTGGVGSGLVRGVEAGGRRSTVSFSSDQLLNFFISKGGDKVGGVAKELLDQEVAPTEERVALDETHREADATQRAFLAAVRSSVAQGDTPQQATDRWASLDPGNVDAGESFRHAYDLAADPDTGIDPQTRERRDPEGRD